MLRFKIIGEFLVLVIKSKGETRIMMNTVLEYLGSNLKFVEIVINLIIVIMFCVLRKRLGGVNKAMNGVCSQVENAYKDTKGQFKKNARGNLERGDKVEIERDDLEPLRKDFNEQFVEFNACANLIAILPLLGLLGTVIGLMPGLNSVKSGDFDQLYSSLSTALTSTFFGLVASIWLKAYISSKPGKTIDKVEINFAEIDRLYEIQ